MVAHLLTAHLVKVDTQKKFLNKNTQVIALDRDIESKKNCRKNFKKTSTIDLYLKIKNLANLDNLKLKNENIRCAFLIWDILIHKSKI